MPSVEPRVPLHWSLFADRMLRQCARTMDACSLASRVGRTPMDVRARALAIGVEFMGETGVMDRHWSDGEIRYLKQQYRRMTPAEIGRQLGRSAGAVRGKLQSLGLRKAYDPKPENLAPPAAWAPEMPEPEPVPAVEEIERQMEREAEPEPLPAEDAPVELNLEPEPEPAPEPAPAPEPFRWWTADEDERLRQLVKEKTPLPELAELFGRHEDEVARRIQRVCAEPDPAVQGKTHAWGFRKKRKPASASPIPESRLEGMSKMDLLRALAGLA